MSSPYPYRIFISHAWTYNAEYSKLERMLSEYPNFQYRNYAVLRHESFDTSQKLTTKLIEQISPVQVVIILAGLYAVHSDWIKFEIKESVRLRKPIIAVKPWGNEVMPTIIQEAATAILGWDVDLIVQSIRRLA